MGNKINICQLIKCLRLCLRKLNKKINVNGKKTWAKIDYSNLLVIQNYYLGTLSCYRHVIRQIRYRMLCHHTQAWDWCILVSLSACHHRNSWYNHSMSPTFPSFHQLNKTNNVGKKFNEIYDCSCMYASIFYTCKPARTENISKLSYSILLNSNCILIPFKFWWYCIIIINTWYIRSLCVAVYSKVAPK